MLTSNAESHDPMKSFHKPADEKRMVVILPEATYAIRLKATSERSQEFLRHYPADRLLTSAAAPAR